MTNDSKKVGPSDEHHGHGFQIRIGDSEQFQQTVTLVDPVPTGRQILAAAERRPEKDYQLFLLTNEGDLEEVGLDETIDLRAPRIEELFVFRSDRVFYFVIDDRRFPWGAESIPESTLKFLARRPSHYTVWLEKEGGEAPVKIEPGSRASLSGTGVEVFRTGLELDIQIDRLHYKVSLESMTGAQLRNLPTPPIGADRDLFEVVPGGSDRKISDGDVVQIRNGLRFFTAPGQINPGTAN